MGEMGGSPTQIIIWLGVATVAGIGFYWFLTHFWNAQFMFETINNDVLALSMRINNNCDANYYSFRYNPRSEKGTLRISKEELCIDAGAITKCAKLYCGPSEDTNINLEGITYIRGKRDGKLVISWE